MKSLFFLLFTCLALSNQSHAGDTTSFSCKYRFTKQSDASNKNSKFDDIMILTVNTGTSVYYSYLKHFGFRNFEKDKKKLFENMSSSNVGNTVSINPSSIDRSKYFDRNETEVIKINFSTKQIEVTDKLFANAYGYDENLTSPKWVIESETIDILKQKCQRATTTFKGRNYSAWFTTLIPYKFGPWLFNGLPGLILKVEDSKGHFQFECIELNTTTSNTKVFKRYTDVKMVSKKQLNQKKKLLIQDPLGFTEMEDGVTVTSTDANGNSVPRKLRPYNPLDLTQ